MKRREYVEGRDLDEPHRIYEEIEWDEGDDDA